MMSGCLVPVIIFVLGWMMLEWSSKKSQKSKCKETGKLVQCSYMELVNH